MKINTKGCFQTYP